MEHMLSTAFVQRHTQSVVPHGTSGSIANLFDRYPETDLQENC
jgi:hypothetical protein